MRRTESLRCIHLQVRFLASDLDHSISRLWMLLKVNQLIPVWKIVWMVSSKWNPPENCLICPSFWQKHITATSCNTIAAELRAVFINQETYFVFSTLFPVFSHSGLVWAYSLPCVCNGYTCRNVEFRNLLSVKLWQLQHYSRLSLTYAHIDDVIELRLGLFYNSACGRRYNTIPMSLPYVFFYFFPEVVHSDVFYGVYIRVPIVTVSRSMCMFRAGAQLFLIPVCTRMIRFPSGSHSFPCFLHHPESVMYM